MTKNTSISLGNHFESFVEEAITTGRYSTTSEVVRAGLRLLEEEESRISILKASIQEGIDSGIATSFDPKSHLAELKARKRSRG